MHSELNSFLTSSGGGVGGRRHRIRTRCSHVIGRSVVDRRMMFGFGSMYTSLADLSRYRFVSSALLVRIMLLSAKVLVIVVVPYRSYLSDVILKSVFKAFL